MQIHVFKIPQQSPDDLSGLEALVAKGQLDPSQIVAILGKTEGNGCVNDFTRGFATQTLKAYLRDRAGQAVADRTIYVMSGGTEGILSPHLTVFTRRSTLPDEPKHWGLALGVSRTRAFLPAEIGTMAMVQTVAAAVRAAIAEAQLAPTNVHFVQIKCPLVTSIQAQSALRASNSYQSMAYSRGASALGVAIALGEIDPAKLTDAAICSDYSLYSSVASTSAGVELQHCEVLVLGNAPTVSSPFVIGHSVMQHGLDVPAVQDAIASTQQPIAQLVTVFAKAEADPSGSILGCRHTMLDDSDINHTRMARAVVGAVVAATVQDPMIYVSGGAEHQGPAGGGTIAAIARLFG
jgi:cyanuric acid amidohydrolase